MADGTAEILLKITSNLEAISKAQEAFIDLQNAAKYSGGSIRDAGKEIESFGSNFRSQFTGSLGLGAGFTAGATAAMAVVGAFRAIGAEITNTLSLGVQFNAEMEQAKLGIAAALRTFDPDKYTTFQSALAASGTVIDQLRAKSRQFGLGFQPLAEQYTATVGAMFRGGITDIQKQIDLTVTLNRAMTTMGITGTRATRDIADILNGVANRTVAGRSLGISDADLKAAADAGQLYEYLNQKLAAFGDAVTASADTVNVLKERLNEVKTQTAADETQDLTNAYKDLLRSLITLTQSEAYKSLIRFFAGGASTAATAIAQAADAMSGKSRQKGGVELEADAGQKAYSSFDSDAGGVRSQSDINAAMAKGERLLKDLKDQFALAMSRPITGDQADEDKATSTLLVLTEQTQKRLDLLKSQGQQQIALNQQAETKNQMERVSLDIAREATEARTAILKKEKEITAERDARMLAAEKKEGGSTYLNDLNFQKGILEQQLKGPEANPMRYIGGSDAQDPSKMAEAKKAALLFRMEIGGKIAQIEGDIAAVQNEAQRKQQEADRKRDEAAKKAETLADRMLAKKRAEAAEDAARTGKSAITGIKDNPYLTNRQKDERLFVEYKRQELILTEQIAALKAREATEPDGSATQAQDRAEIKRLKDELAALQNDETQTAPTSVGQDTTKSLVTLTNSFKTVGSSIAGTVGSALNSVSSNITALIMKTKTWKDAFKSVATTVVTDIVSSFTRMATEWVAKEAIMTLASRVGAAQRTLIKGSETTASVTGSVISTAAHVSSETTKTSATLMGGAIRLGVTIKEALASVFAAAAGAMQAMASIPYIGPFLAVAAMAAMIAVGIGLVGKIGKGFSKGGYTGDGGVTEVAGQVHRGEVVFSQADVAAHGGAAAVENLRVKGRGAFGGASPVAASGAASAKAMQAEPPHVSIAHFDTRQTAEQYLRTRKGRKFMSDFNKQEAFET